MAKEMKMSTEQAAGLGALAATVATAGAAAVGYYFYASKDAVHNRKIAKKWARDFKVDVVNKARKMKAMDQKMLGMAIAEASKKYEMMQSVDKKEVAKAVKELKANWQNLAAEMQKSAKKTVKTVKKVTAKASKQAKKPAKPVRPSGGKVAKKAVKKVAKPARPSGGKAAKKK